VIEYIKIIIIALVCGFMAPLPSSSSAHFSIISNAVNLTTDESKLGFYFALFGVTFAVVIFFCLRKIYFKSFKTLFSGKSKRDNNSKIYIKVAKNILLSILPAVLLFIPLGEEKLLLDYFDKFLSGNGLYLTGFACIINALVLLVARWYSKQENKKLKRVCGTMSAVRMSFYQLVSYIVPGFSHVASGSTNMLVSDVHPKFIMREVYLYLAPTMFIVNIAKIVKYLINDTIINAVTAAIGIVIFAVMSFIVMRLVAKFNTKRVLLFFSIYSIVLGVVAIVFTFMI
jgi:undecaprenyl pyrophosphate phosphatase UppP